MASNIIEYSKAQNIIDVDKMPIHHAVLNIFLITNFCTGHNEYYIKLSKR